MQAWKSLFKLVWSIPSVFVCVCFSHCLNLSYYHYLFVCLIVCLIPAVLYIATAGIQLDCILYKFSFSNFADVTVLNALSKQFKLVCVAVLKTIERRLRYCSLVKKIHLPIFCQLQNINIHLYSHIKMNTYTENITRLGCRRTFMDVINRQLLEQQQKPLLGYAMCFGER